MTMRVHVAGATQERLIHEYQADLLGAPFPVVLVDSVRKEFHAQSEEKIRVVIPDMDGLLRMVAACRSVYPQKLSGAEIKFLRQAVGCRAKDVASALDMTPENISRVENGTKPLGPQAEKMFRVMIIMRLTEDKHIHCSALSRMAKIVDLKIMPVVDARNKFELRLTYCEEAVDSLGHNDPANDDGQWYEPMSLRA